MKMRQTTLFVLFLFDIPVPQYGGGSSRACWGMGFVRACSDVGSVR